MHRRSRKRVKLEPCRVRGPLLPFPQVLDIGKKTPQEGRDFERSSSNVKHTIVLHFLFYNFNKDLKNFFLFSQDPPTPGTGVPESQVIFDPSPEKPPTFRRLSY